MRSQPRAALLLVTVLLHLLAVRVSSYAKLQDLRSDQGIWDNEFDPDRTSYNVQLAAGTMSVSVACAIDVTRYPKEAQPIIRFNNTKVDYNTSGTATHLYTLPATPYDYQLVVDVSVSESLAMAKTVYHLKFSRPPDFPRLLALTQLKIVDDTGQALATNPAFIAAVSPSSSYKVYISPNTKRVNLTTACDPQASTFVDNSAVAAGSPVALPMDFRSTHTVVTISCTYQKHSQAVTVEFRGHVQLQFVNLTLHVLGDAGFIQQPDSSTFVVFSLSSTVVVIPMYNDSRVGLDLLTKSGETLRLGVGVPTPRLDVPANGTEAHTLSLHSTNGNQTRQFALILRRYALQTSTTSPPPQRLANDNAKCCGYILASVLGICIFTLSVIRGVCEAFGLGTPRFASPALRSFVLLLQFVAFSSLLVEPCTFTDFAGPLRWLAISPPADKLWTFLSKGSGRRLSAVNDRTFGSTEGAMSLSCSGAILTVVLVLHILALVRLLLGGCLNRRYTVPHRLTLGGWEARCLLLLAYPVSCASMLLLLRATQDPPRFGTPMMWILVALGALAFLLLVTVVAECTVRHALAGRLVTWVFEGGSATSGDEENDEKGYFCDATCNQIATVSTERSCCSAFISHRWGTTVADIQPIELEQTLTERAVTARLLAAKDELEDVAAQADGTAEVEVVATLRPGALCQPFYCEVGRCTNVAWLWAQLDAPALLRLHQEVDRKFNDFATPLRVNVSQLQGPVTSGRLSFCFDGLHWPHLPPLELFSRILFGCLTAIAIALPQLRAPALFASSFLSGVLFVFIFFHTPCVSIMENALLLLAYLGLALVAFVLSAYIAGVFSLQVCNWALAISVALVGVPLFTYVVLASLSLFVAASCPRVSEEEMESHSYNNVDLSLRGPHDAWLLVVPAKCTVPVSDVFVHTREMSGGSSHVFVTENVGKGQGARPRLEFPVLDYLAPSDKLEVPRVVLIGPSQNRSEDFGGYRSETIYEDEDPRTVLADFLRRSTLAAEHVPGVSAEVLGLMNKHSRPNHILVVDLMEPPRQRQFTLEDDGYDSAGSEEELESLMGTTRSQTNRTRDLRKIAIDDD